MNAKSTFIALGPSGEIEIFTAARPMSYEMMHRMSVILRLEAVVNIAGKAVSYWYVQKNRYGARGFNVSGTIAREYLKVPEAAAPSLQDAFFSVGLLPS